MKYNCLFSIRPIVMIILVNLVHHNIFVLCVCMFIVTLMLFVKCFCSCGIFLSVIYFLSVVWLNLCKPSKRHGKHEITPHNTFVGGNVLPTQNRQTINNKIMNFMWYLRYDSKTIVTNRYRTNTININTKILLVFS